MSAAMIAVLLGSTAINLWLAQRSARDRIRRRIDEVTLILETASFPLNDRVLEQMAGLAGAEFILAKSDGIVVAKSNPAVAGLDFELGAADVDGTDEFAKTVRLNESQYLHRAIHLDRFNAAPDLRLHTLFPADEYRRIWQRALLPSLLSMGAALAAALLCAYWIGSSVRRVTLSILEQLQRIATGDFRSSDLPRRDDELRDISTAVNQTAGLLEQFEGSVREGERMKTMVAMGAGLAHQIRNSSTGCRMALDVVVEENELSGDEAMQVARRQLSLMDNYLQRFLMLAKVEPSRIEHQTEDLRVIVDRAVSLVRHSAKHLNVELKRKSHSSEGERPAQVVGDIVAIEQAVVNLLLNAIEASSTAATEESEPRAEVYVKLAWTSDETVQIVVSDNGAGPSADQDVFAPFVSDKKAGVGLGLAVVKEVATEHNGQASWSRNDGWTDFAFELPTRQMETT